MIKDRVLMVGVLSSCFVRDNWVAPLRAAYDAAFVDVSPLFNAYSRDFVEPYLYRIIQHGGFSRLFFYSEAVQAEFSDAFFDRVRAAGLEVVVFHADDDPEVWYRQNAAYDHRYDRIYSPSRQGVDRRRAEGCEAQVEYLPWGYNPALFYPATGAAARADKRYGVVFAGANMSPRNNPQQYLREGGDRQQTLVEIDAICQRHGIDFALFGHGWDHHPTLHRRHRGFPEQDELLRIYQQARIVVNTGFSADGEGCPQTKLRHFEVAGCGAFQLVNDNPELRALFEPDREMVFYRDTAELEAKLLHYLEHEDEREAIATAAERRARLEHTQERRVRVIFGAPPRRSAAPRPLVHTLVVPTTEADEQRLAGEIAAGRFQDCAALCFLDPALELVACEHSVLNPGWHQAPVHAWAVRTFVQLARLHGNLLHRRKQDIRGLALHERVDKTRYRSQVLALLRRHLSCLEDEDALYPLCNLLIRPEQALAALWAYRRGDLAAIKALAPLPTGRLVNDCMLEVAVAGEATFLSDATYLEPLRDLLALIARTGETLLVYGAAGEMVDQIIPLLTAAADVRLLGFADRRLAGSRLGHWPIVAPEAIADMQPDLILIAAESSGPAIYRDLEARQGRATLLPLYDLAAPVWRVMLP